MRLHSDILTAHDIRGAAWSAGIPVEIVKEGGSRTRKRQFYIDAPKNEWDAVGQMIALLYRVDPLAVWGSSDRDRHGYWSELDFHYRTGERFMDLPIEDPHRRHRWMVDPCNPDRYCSTCSAVWRWGHLRTSQKQREVIVR